MFSTVIAPVYLPPEVNCHPPVPHILSFFIFAELIGAKWYLIVTLILVKLQYIYIFYIFISHLCFLTCEMPIHDLFSFSIDVCISYWFVCGFLFCFVLLIFNFEIYLSLSCLVKWVAKWFLSLLLVFCFFFSFYLWYLLIKRSC